MRPNTIQYGPEQGGIVFERRLRITCAKFNRIFEGVVSKSECMRRGLTPNATGGYGISSFLKVIFALSMLSYGLPADLADDLFNMQRSTARISLEEFCITINTCFAEEYLHSPTTESMFRVECSESMCTSFRFYLFVHYCIWGNTIRGTNDANRTIYWVFGLTIQGIVSVFFRLFLA